MKKARAADSDEPAIVARDYSDRPPQFVELEILATARYDSRSDWTRAAERIARLMAALPDAPTSPEATRMVAQCRALELDFRRRRRAAAQEFTQRIEEVRRQRRDIVDRLEALMTEPDGAAVRDEIARLEAAHQEIQTDERGVRVSNAAFASVMRRLQSRFPPIEDPLGGLTRPELLARLETLVVADSPARLQQAHEVIDRIDALEPDDLAAEAYFQEEVRRIIARLETEVDASVVENWRRMAELKNKVIDAIMQVLASGEFTDSEAKIVRLRELWPMIGSAGFDDRHFERRFMTACARYDAAIDHIRSPRIIPPLPRLRNSGTEISADWGNDPDIVENGRRRPRGWTRRLFKRRGRPES